MDLSPFWISLRVALTATVISFFLGLYLAYRMKDSLSKIFQFVDIILNLPLVLPPTVAGLLLLMLFGKKGPLGGVMYNLGYQIIFTKEGAVMAAVFVSLPLMYRCAKSAFEQLDMKLIEAGRTLGMSELSIFTKIILPLSLPGIISGVILAFARALGEFGATLIIAGNIPKVTQTMPLVIYMNLQSGNYELALVWSGILIAFSFIMMLLIKCISHKYNNGYFGYRQS